MLFLVLLPFFYFDVNTIFSLYIDVIQTPAPNSSSAFFLIQFVVSFPSSVYLLVFQKLLRSQTHGGWSRGARFLVCHYFLVCLFVRCCWFPLHSLPLQLFLFQPA